MQETKASSTEALIAQGSYRTVLAALLLGASLAVLGVALLVGANQLVHAVRTITLVLQAGDPQGAVKGLWPEWVRRFMVDISVVTPGLVGVTAAYMASGAGLLLRSDDSSRFTNPAFPFPGRYKVYYVQMGLAGTVFGFIVAFWNPKLQAATHAEVLLTALSAALWSTLTAVVLAYLICPLLIEPVYQWLARGRGTSGEDPLALLESRASAAGRALEDLRRSAAETTGTLDLQAMSAKITALAAEVGRIQRQVSTTEQTLDGLSTEIAEIRGDVAGVTALVTSLDGRLKAVEAEGERRARAIQSGLRRLAERLYRLAGE
jgi:hypothetical protein